MAVEVALWCGIFWLGFAGSCQWKWCFGTGFFGWVLGLILGVGSGEDLPFGGLHIYSDVRALVDPPLANLEML